jgi:hypothetical protein
MPPADGDAVAAPAAGSTSSDFVSNARPRPPHRAPTRGFPTQYTKLTCLDQVRKLYKYGLSRPPRP